MRLESFPSEKMHVFALNQLVNAVDKMLQTTTTTRTQQRTTVATYTIGHLKRTLQRPLYDVTIGIKATFYCNCHTLILILFLLNAFVNHSLRPLYLNRGLIFWVRLTSLWLGSDAPLVDVDLIRTCFRSAIG